MKSYMKCKACGYVMEAGSVKDKCPACGLPAKQFEPYEEKVSEKRKRILDLHIHPVVVHMPQAFAATLVLLALAIAALGGTSLGPALVDTARVLSALLPLFVAAAFAAGLLDGKIRFRRVTTPLLVRKMVAGALFFALALAGGALALFAPLSGAPLAAFGVLEALGLGAGALLGIWGSGLMGAKFPG
jgi:rubredoxin